MGCQYRRAWGENLPYHRYYQFSISVPASESLLDRIRPIVIDETRSPALILFGQDRALRDIPSWRITHFGRGSIGLAKPLSATHIFQISVISLETVRISANEQLILQDLLSMT